jgi:hypothetical protein
LSGSQRQPWVAIPDARDSVVQTALWTPGPEVKHAHNTPTIAPARRRRLSRYRAHESGESMSPARSKTCPPFRGRRPESVGEARSRLARAMYATVRCCQTRNTPLQHMTTGSVKSVWFLRSCLCLYSREFRIKTRNSSDNRGWTRNSFSQREMVERRIEQEPQSSSLYDGKPIRPRQAGFPGNLCLGFAFP